MEFQQYEVTHIHIQVLEYGLIGIVRFNGEKPRFMTPQSTTIKLEKGDFVTEVLFANEHRNFALEGIQFVFHKGWKSPVFGSASFTGKYRTTLERGGITGLIRYRSLLIGIAHSNGRYILPVAVEEKSSFQAKLCFYVNVLCCAQDCSGNRSFDARKKKTCCCMCYHCCIPPKCICFVPFVPVIYTVSLLSNICCPLNPNDPGTKIWTNLALIQNDFRLPSYYPGSFWPDDHGGHFSELTPMSYQDGDGEDGYIDNGKFYPWGYTEDNWGILRVGGGGWDVNRSGGL